VEISTCESDEDAFEFLSGRKPMDARAIRFERDRLVRSERDDVTVLTGLFERTVPDAARRGVLSAPIGLLHLDTDTYLHTTLALQPLMPYVAAGTVVVLDKFHDYPTAEREVTF